MGVEIPWLLFYKTQLLFYVVDSVEEMKVIFPHQDEKEAFPLQEEEGEAFPQEEEDKEALPLEKKEAFSWRRFTP